MKTAIESLIETIEATGGLIRLLDGRLHCVGDEEWDDLADAYVMACTETGRKPLVKK